MSVSWGVMPVDPEEHEGMYEWLRDNAGYEATTQGRYPTLEEMLAVLHSLDISPVQQDPPEIDDETHLIELSVGNPYTTDRYAQMLGHIDGDNRYEFHFLGSTDTWALLKILRGLAETCGPLVCYDTYTVTPVVVTATTDVDQALADWQARQSKKLA
jgi:hypothetical protein